MKRILLLFLSLCLTISAFSQEKQAVQTPAIWLRSDQLNNQIQYWPDVSGNQRHATSASQLKVTENVLNFNPVISFAGINDAKGISYTTNSLSGLTIITAFHSTDTSSKQGIWSIDINGKQHSALTNTELLRTNNALTYPVKDAEKPSINSSVQSWTKERIKNNEVTFTIGKAVLPNSTTISFSGNMAECLVFEEFLNKSDILKIESYLAIKYGITLEKSDYLSSKNDTLWNYELNKKYSNDIAGIGKDSVFNLNQKQSSSVLDDVLTISAGLLQADNSSNTSNLPENSYLLWGHNNYGMNFKLFPIDASHFLSHQHWLMQAKGNSASIATEVKLKIPETELNSSYCGLAYMLAIDRSGKADRFGDGNFSAGGIEYIPASFVDEEGYAHFQNVYWDTDGSGSDAFTLSYIIPTHIISRLYVNAANTASIRDGSSWGKAFLSLTEALNRAKIDKCIKEIWVAQGTYKGSYTMLNDVAIYGGFRGTEVNISERRQGEKTILQENERYKSIIHNAYTEENPLTNTAILDGFTIRNSNAGGITNEYASPAISNCKIMENGNDDNYGGGIYNDNSSPILTNVVIARNLAMYGGGMFNSNQSFPKLNNVYIVGNSADIAGGVLNENSFFRMTNGLIARNFAESGGAMENWSGNTVLTNVLVIQNISNGGVAGIENVESYCKLTNVTIAANGSAAGGVGGIAMYNSDEELYTEIQNSIIWGNFPTNTYIDNSYSSFSYSLIEGAGGSANWNTDYGANMGNNIDKDPIFEDFIPVLSIIDCGLCNFYEMFDKLVSENFIEEIDYYFYDNQYALSDFLQGENFGKYNLGWGSPAAGTGLLDFNTTEFDLSGNPRNCAANFISMGAYESDGGVFYRLYVNAANTGVKRPSGVSWETAFPTLEDALHYAGWYVNEIWVAKGTYQPQAGSSYKIHGNFAIYGGFTGMETALSQRNWKENETTLQGNGASVIANYSNASIDGFTITKGKGTMYTEASGYKGTFGGGIFSTGGSPSIRNCTIKNNTADQGGAIYTNNSSADLANVIIENNQATKGDGGGISNYGNSSLSFTNVKIVGNYAEEGGGGIYNVNNTYNTKLVNVLVAGNTCFYGYGAGIFHQSDGQCTLINTTISANYAGAKAGGLYVQNTLKPAIVQNSIIWGNKANRGDDNIYSTDVKPLFQYNILEGSGGSGAGFWEPNFGQDGGNNIDKNPLFIDYQCPIDAKTPITTGNYQLQNASIASDNGDLKYNSSLTDLNGNARVYNDVIDLGAYESRYDVSRLYVNQSNTGGIYNGYSWQKAFRTLTEALNFAKNNKSVKEIWVSQGSYSGGFSMLNNVAIYGGFRGAEINISERPINARTLLIGGGSVVFNAFTQEHPLDSSAIIDGFIIGGGIAEKGGGIHNEYASPTISNCIISNNSANIRGGGIYNFYSSPKIIGVEISSNSAISGGGILNERYSSPVLINVSITKNTARAMGGGIVNMYNCSPLLINTLVAKNLVMTEYGSAIHTEWNSKCTLVNVTIAENTGIEGYGISTYRHSTLEVKNSIIWGNSGKSIVNQSSSQSSFENSIVFGSGGSFSGKWEDIGADLGNNIDQNPLYENALGDNYQLQSNSPAINVGYNDFNTTLTDLDGNARVYNDIIDMGAYESQYNNFPRLYVDIANTGGIYNGYRWQTAFCSLNDALNFAKENTSVKEIWVAKGMYFGTYTMLNNVGIYGGFNGTETELSQRNWTNNKTLLLGGPTAFIAKDPVVSNIYTSDNPLTHTAVLDGFTILFGKGGVSNEYASPTISNCIIQGNLYGGGIKNLYYSSPVITNVIIEKNFASFGGGICNGWFSSPILTNVIIRNNLALAAGGIYNYAFSSPTLTSVRVLRNDAQYEGGGMFNDSESYPTLTNVLIAENIAHESAGGGIFNVSSGCKLINTTIAKNISIEGGGIYHEYYDSITEIQNCIIWGNIPDNISLEYEYGLFYTHSLVEGSGGSYNWDNAIGGDLGNNIDGNPLFKNIDYEREAPDFSRLSRIVSSMSESVMREIYEDTTDVDDPIYNDYGLQNNSLAINAGYNAYNTSSTDLDGNARVYNDLIDMGAYESQYNSLFANKRLYVNASNISAYYTGLSWQRAFRTLTEALNAAKINPLVEEIWVAKGTYQPAKDSSFKMMNNVAIYGGFLGTETELPQRNWETNATILLGNGSPVISNNYTSSDSNLLNHTAILDGFSIREGKGINAASVGSVLCGGGIYNSYASPNISNCIVENCTADQGGAIYNTHSNVKYKNVTIRNNNAGKGGGVFNRYGTPVFEEGRIETNIASEGGGIYNAFTEVTIKNVSIQGNLAYENGGGISNLNSTIQFTNVLITGNVAKGSSGGGIYHDRTQGNMINVTMSGNYAKLRGGGISGSIFNAPSLITEIQNCIIWGNKTGGATAYSNIYKNKILLIIGQTLMEGSLGDCSDYGYDYGNNIDEKPLFVDYQYAADMNTPTTTGNFRLQNNSPAIAAGYSGYNTSYVDLDGNRRTTKGTICMGPYENNTSITKRGNAISQDTSSAIEPDDMVFEMRNNGQEPIKVYPNPVANGKTVFVEINTFNEQTETAKIEVFNTIGAKLGEHTVLTKKTDIALPKASGEYILRISINNTLVKIVKVVVI